MGVCGVGPCLCLAAAITPEGSLVIDIVRDTDVKGGQSHVRIGSIDGGFGFPRPVDRGFGLKPSMRFLLATMGLLPADCTHFECDKFRQRHDFTAFVDGFCSMVDVGVAVRGLSVLALEHGLYSNNIEGAA